jgi:hypothetical protein
MTNPSKPRDRELERRWVETWRRAGEELAEVRRREIENVNTEDAIRQIFGDDGVNLDAPSPPISGLVQQQAWFSRLRFPASRR